MDRPNLTGIHMSFLGEKEEIGRTEITSKWPKKEFNNKQDGSI
jgi:hypothetical protein